MSSPEVAPVGGPRLVRIAPWFDVEAAAVVTILLGLFQIFLSAVLISPEETSLPKFFILPLILGILVVTAGSFTIASERNPSRKLLHGCAFSNAAGLLGAALAFCLYCHSLGLNSKDRCTGSMHPDRDYETYRCPFDMLSAFSWSVSLLLLLYDIGALVMHAIFSFSAFKALRV
ncbi:uncharacterized protein LOC142903274 [Nelusetta ayraudi]|uniref:uncharacterized protein LOC142903274 n=1 Tax=Nelusetta ayraudi TaxID=303726 RepID=UPI003F72540E